MKHILGNLLDYGPDRLLEIEMYGKNDIEITVHGPRGGCKAYLKTNAAELRNFCRAILADEIMEEK